MILFASEGLSNDEIASRLDSRREVVGRWRKRSKRVRVAPGRFPTLVLHRLSLSERYRPGWPSRNLAWGRVRLVGQERLEHAPPQEPPAAGRE